MQRGEGGIDLDRQPFTFEAVRDIDDGAGTGKGVKNDIARAAAGEDTGLDQGGRHRRHVRMPGRTGGKRPHVALVALRLDGSGQPVGTVLRVPAGAQITAMAADVARTRSVTIIREA